VLAEVGSVGAGRVASLEAEEVATNEVVPLEDLLGLSATPGSGVDETTHRVATLQRPSGVLRRQRTKPDTHEVSTVGVHLSSPVTLENVDEGLVNETNSLNVVRGPHPLDTLEGACGNETSAVTGLGAPGNHLALNVSDLSAVLGGTPQAEVWSLGLAENVEPGASSTHHRWS